MLPMKYSFCKKPFINLEPWHEGINIRFLKAIKYLLFGQACYRVLVRIVMVVMIFGMLVMEISWLTGVGVLSGKLKNLQFH